jgi:UDP-glucose:(heptosyl)LPS alpha-1,3-glucosyltransferase
MRAKRLALAHLNSFLGHHEEIPDSMAATDLLVHPARHERTLILEAVVNGLPGRHDIDLANMPSTLLRHKPERRLRAVHHAGLGRGAVSCRRCRAALPNGSASAERYGAQSFLYDGRRRAAQMTVGVAAERGPRPLR